MMRISRRVAIAALLLAGGCDRGAQPAMVGSPAPDFTIHDGAHTVTLSHLRGKPVLLNFWATWCQPCVEELPSLIELHRQMPQLEILAVNVDHDADVYNQFLASHPLPFDLVRDPAEISDKLYHTDGFPETFVIDSRGILRRHMVGPQDWATPAMLEYLRNLQS
jgi:cytochrome c biogenesis protein CcmG/thiol:disulfide interchange protein DsbE